MEKTTIFKKNVKKKSEYGKQLEEKQELKKIYGLREGKMRKYVEMARKLPGDTSDNMLILLERRMDNVIYQIGFAQTRAQARQFATHGLFKLNGRRVDVPSIQIDPDDEIVPRKIEQFKDREMNQRADWVIFNKKTLSGSVKRLPTRDDIDIPINEDLVIQFYSR